MAARIEQETGRIPGRRETRELKDDAKQKLLPQAFPRDSELWGLICPARGVMIVSTASDTKGALLCSELIRACVDADVLAAPSKGLPALSARNLRTRTSIDAFMLQALLEPDAVKPFGPATYCVLQAQDESRRQVSYRNHELTGNEEIRRHLQMGHLPSKLGLYLEAHTYFELDPSLGLHKIEFTGDLFQPPGSPADGQDDAFDGDFALLGGGLLKVYDEITQFLGVERLDDPESSSLV